MMCLYNPQRQQGAGKSGCWGCQGFGHCPVTRQDKPKPKEPKVLEVRQRLDTGMFYVTVNGVGWKVPGTGKIKYYADIRDAEKFKAHYIRHSKPFQD